MADFIGPLISAGSTLLGGLLGSSQTDKANKAAAQIADRNIALQKEFARNGIQWKVADALDAGVHPLYALGAQTTSFSPVSVGVSPNTSMASALAGAGQDIGRAVNATLPQSKRLQAYAEASQTLSLQRQGLENELLASQIRKLNQAGPTPAMPSGGDRYLISGQGNSPVSASSLIKEEPMERTVSAPGAPHLEPGALPDTGFARTPTGLAPVPSKDVKDRIEDALIPELMWAFRNYVLPQGMGGSGPPNTSPGPGKKWVWSPFTFQWTIAPINNGRPRRSGYRTGGSF